jgi:transposase
MGGYERGVVEHLRTAGFTVLVLQPIQVKAFGQVHSRRAKNDALNAVLIAACAAALDPPRIAPDPPLAELAGYLTFLDQLEEDIARFKTRLEHIDDPRLRRLVNNDIARLKVRRAAQIRDIAKRLRAYDDLAKRFDLVLSIPGIGERTALALIIRVPELGRVSREEAAALAGLAPFDHDSGQHKAQRQIAAERCLLAPLRKPHCQRRHIASPDRMAAQLLEAGQYFSEHPLHLAQFKSNVNRAIVHRGGYVSVIEIRRLGPPRLDGGCKSNPNHPPTHRI